MIPNEPSPEQSNDTRFQEAISLLQGIITTLLNKPTDRALSKIQISFDLAKYLNSSSTSAKENLEHIMHVRKYLALLLQLILDSIVSDGKVTDSNKDIITNLIEKKSKVISSSTPADQLGGRNFGKKIFTDLKVLYIAIEICFGGSFSLLSLTSSINMQADQENFFIFFDKLLEGGVTVIDTPNDLDMRQKEIANSAKSLTTFLEQHLTIENLLMLNLLQTLKIDIEEYVKSLSSFILTSSGNITADAVINATSLLWTICNQILNKIIQNLSHTT